MSRLHIAILCLAASRFGGLPQRAEAAARGVNEGLPLAGDTGMLQGRFQGLRCRDASAKMPFVLPIRPAWPEAGVLTQATIRTGAAASG